MRLDRRGRNQLTYGERDAQNRLIQAFKPKERADVIIDGVCVHHHTLESGWGFATISTPERHNVSITGTLGGDLYDGARVRAHGYWANHDRYGWQVKLRVLEIHLSTSIDGVQAWFQERFPDIGPVRAQALLGHFGMDIWDVIENEPTRLAEAPNIGEKLAQQIHATYLNYRHEREAYVFLAGWGLGPEAIRKAFNLWGRETQKMLEENPYQLIELPGIGFKQADRVARQGGIKATDPRRILAGYTYAMELIEREGSTCASAQKILAVAAGNEVLGLTLTTVRPLFDQAVEEGGLIGEFDRFFRRTTADAEHLIATQVGDLLAKRQPNG